MRPSRTCAPDPSFPYRQSLREGLSPEQFQTFLAQARRNGWRRTVAEYASQGLLKYEYVINDGRADWRFLLPLTPESTVVDVGCGWGTTAFPLSQDCRVVYALDAVPERLQFVRLRSQQDGVRNILPIEAKLPALPLPTQCCEVVVLNGVLEWLGVADLQHSPRRAQQVALCEVSRLIRPGGCVYIGIENRFGAKYLLGAQEDHVRLRFVGVVPRVVGNWISRWHTGKPFRVHTPSYMALSHMLRQAGFTDLQFLSPLPDYKVLNVVLSTDSPAPLRFYFNHMRLARYQSCKQQLLAWLWPRLFANYQAWLTHSFSVLAYKK